jgi:hypothetical protein
MSPHRRAHPERSAYSSRSVITGSMRLARQDGTTVAITSATTSAPAGLPA